MKIKYYFCHSSNFIYNWKKNYATRPTEHASNENSNQKIPFDPPTQKHFLPNLNLFLFFNQSFDFTAILWTFHSQLFLLKVYISTIYIHFHIFDNNHLTSGKNRKNKLREKSCFLFEEEEIRKNFVKKRKLSLGENLSDILWGFDWAICMKNFMKS